MLYDVIIAGAGPAGSTCARACAKAGLRTLLLERDRFPRDKPCGGAVSARALACLDFALPLGIIERECFGVRVHYGPHTIDVRKDRRIAVIVRREQFDQFLAERAVEACAVLRQGEPVRNMAVRRDHVEVTTDSERHDGRCIVGADGANSIVGRTIRPIFPRDEMDAALVGTVAAGDHEIDARIGNLLEMYFGVAPLGYGWVFPRKGSYQVGVMGQASKFMAPHKVQSDFCTRAGMPVPRTKGHTIPWGGKSRPVTGPRMLLAGDAAGFADPFHGEGIANAILSGKLAAQAVIDGIQGKKDSLAWYAAECDRLITSEMRIALSMARMLERRPKLFLTIFFSDRKALERYLDIATGKSDYHGFRRWLLLRLPGYLLSLLRGNAFSMM